MYKMKKIWLVFLVSLLVSANLIGADNYKLSHESTTRAKGVKRGKVTAFEFEGSKIFPSTKRGCWIYVPAGYDGSKPAALMVFQDGHAYVSESGQIRVPIVFDNLIHSGEIPLTVGLFVNPGHRGKNPPNANGWGRRDNRSLEYDSLGADYANFLIKELIPYTEKKFNLKLTDDPELRAICGMSSGGICAFTAAWEKPNYFKKVLSHIGSFTNIRGGHVYPALIRKAERKDIRVFLQDGSNDLNNVFGSWPIANQQMASALGFSGYDYKFVYGDGAHNGKHGGAIFPDSLRWLWRNEKKTATEKTREILDDTKEGNWQMVGSGYKFTDAACPTPGGGFLFSDLQDNTLYRVSSNGQSVEPWFEGAPRISGMKFGNDGVLYAARQGSDDEKSIIGINPATKKFETIAVGVKPNDLVVSDGGFVYFTDTGSGTVVMVPRKARNMSRPSPVAGGINKPNGIGLSPDQKFLYVSEYGGEFVWAFMIGDDGKLESGEKYMTLEKPHDNESSGGDGLFVDGRGRSFITSHAGIQVMDDTGRLVSVIEKPQEGPTVSCAITGSNGQWLYVCSKDKVFKRKLKWNN